MGQRTVRTRWRSACAFAHRDDCAYDQVQQPCRQRQSDRDGHSVDKASAWTHQADADTDQNYRKQGACREVIASPVRAIVSNLNYPDHGRGEGADAEQESEVAGTIARHHEGGIDLSSDQLHP